MAASEEGSRSKSRLLDALVRLMDSKAFKDITVVDICAEARVSRQTFYRHFANKYDLVQWHFKRHGKAMPRMGRDLNVRDALVLGFRELGKYRDFYRNTADEYEYESVQALGRSNRDKTLRETIVKHLGVRLDEELEFQIKFYSEEEAKIVREFFYSDKPVDPEKLAGLLESCMPKRLHDLIDGSHTVKGE